MFPEGVLNYTRCKLLVNELPVESMTIVGLLAERVPKIAQDNGVGMAGLQVADLPDHLAMSLDGRGVCKVGVFPGDKALALDVARSVVAKLSGVGLMVRDACVPVRSKTGKKLGEHDVLLELVSDGEGGLPLVAMRGYPSVELKLRRLWKPAEQQERRLQLQANCVGQGKASSRENCTWWSSERDKHPCRLLVMVLFPNKEGNEFRVKADVKHADEESWRPLFGWVGSSRANLVPKPVPTAPPPKPLPKPAPKPLPKPPPKPASKPPEPKYTSAVVGQLTFVGGYAELKSLLFKVGRAENQASYYAEQSVQRHGWTSDEIGPSTTTRAVVASHGAKRRKVGGAPPLVAKRHVLVQMCKDWFGK